jgi:hypothetical protein
MPVFECHGGELPVSTAAGTDAVGGTSGFPRTVVLPFRDLAAHRKASARVSFAAVEGLA